MPSGSLRRMLFNALVLLATFLHICGVHATAVAIRRAGGPVVSLNYATIEGASTGGVDKFLGIPYAQPPVGNLRFRRPRPPLPSSDTILATTFGNACPQQNYTLPFIPNLNYTALVTFVSKVNASEDCLFANVFRPAGVTENSKLPVVVWFYGGAFAIGDGSSYDGSAFVQRSVELGEPLIYINFNYRGNAFGWLAGKEALAGGAANLGLYDQKLFLAWIETYISEFGGDPNKVTVWGHSAGSLSLTAHLITNPVNPPFKAAIFQSSYTSPIYKTDDQKHQATYDHLVQFTGCTSAPDTLECLRVAPYATLKDAINTTPSFLSPNGLDLTWDISIDGDLIKKSLKQYICDGGYARVPILGGQVDDEGTFFSLYSQSITTDADVKTFLKAHLYPTATDDQVNSIADKYSEDPAEGSPFGTGNLSALTPEFKRLAAIQGDHIFHAGRRAAFSKYAATQNVWSFLWKRRKNLLYIGSVHGGELPEMYGLTGDHVGTDAFVNFINHHDPNHPRGSTATSLLSNITWPKYTLDDKKILLFSDDAKEEYTTIYDTYRADGITTIINVQRALGV
ncbi:sterol esterase [Thelephora ganbajun]|uniref:Sterol esterase n=1 Tax=Thelephora ganbajun TaxID=370292 RepID=A0ACB6Z1P0_THEGA|nr:sterol esterase [Thelephora ganbajun]